MDGIAQAKILQYSRDGDCFLARNLHAGFGLISLSDPTMASGEAELLAAESMVACNFSCGRSCMFDSLFASRLPDDDGSVVS